MFARLVRERKRDEELVRTTMERSLSGAGLLIILILVLLGLYLGLVFLQG